VLITIVYLPQSRLDCSPSLVMSYKADAFLSKLVDQLATDDVIALGSDSELEDADRNVRSEEEDDSDEGFDYGNEDVYSTAGKTSLLTGPSSPNLSDAPGTFPTPSHPSASGGCSRLACIKGPTRTARLLRCHSSAILKTLPSSNAFSRPSSCPLRSSLRRSRRLPLPRNRPPQSPL
jgi:hypothetical protein